MKYASIALIAAHTKKHRATVLRALRQAGVTPESHPGVKGKRLPLNEANKFLLRQWPGIAPIQ